MEKKASNAVEMAAQKNEKREKIEKTAQGWVKINFLCDYYDIILCSKYFIKR